ncbi:hypothetical protein AAFF_G00389470 [Aldrovandia affinis]|uniref:Uncharacterized protein n=1 Tax=Aldrovandia affinis TaxID=143900 RepID=A0AAD7SEG0_9TELE|nr:hypothetical protein AAFF_G00389470 [Aldrovandia affinis]
MKPPARLPGKRRDLEDSRQKSDALDARDGPATALKENDDELNFTQTSQKLGRVNTRAERHGALGAGVRRGSDGVAFVKCLKMSQVKRPSAGRRLALPL